MEDKQLQEQIARIQEEIEQKKEEQQHLINDNAAKGEEYAKLFIKKNELQKLSNQEKKPSASNANAEENANIDKAKQISSGVEYLWKKRIEAKLSDLIEDKIQILKGGMFKYESSEEQRPFVNSIKVKLRSKDIGIVKKNKKRDEYVEQKFRITKDTTFDNLKAAACDFWGIELYKYTLCDENFHDLMSLNQDPSHIAHTVEKYFLITRAKTVPVLYLQKPDRENSHILTQQRDAIRIRSDMLGGENRVKVQQQQQGRQQVSGDSERNNIRKFLQTFPGMSQYYIGEESKRKLNRNHLQSPDSKFCTLVVMLLLLLFTVLSIYLRRDLNEHYWTNKLVTNVFDISNFQTDVTVFEDITNVEDFKVWVRNTFSQVVFKPMQGLQPLLFAYIVPIGKIRFRQQRSTAKTCLLPQYFQNCINERISDGKETSSQGNGTYAWHKYRSATEANIMGNFYGENEIYDGSGYMMDLDFNQTKAEFQVFADELFKESNTYINASTRAHFITFSFYNPSSDYFVTIDIMVEFLVPGIVKPTYLKVMPFKPNIFEQSNEKALQACDIGRLLLCFYLVFSIYKKIRYQRKIESAGRLLISVLLDFGIIFFFFFGWILSYYYSTQRSIDLINSTEFVDYVNKALWFAEAFHQDSICLMFIMFKIIWVFRISRFVHWILLTIDDAISSIVSFLIIIVPVFGAFTFFVYILFGPYIYNFHTFSYALKTVIFYILGQLNTEEMVKANTVIAVAWTYVFYFFQIFIFLSIFMAIFVTSYEKTINEYGYPSDFEGVVKWTYQDYLKWMMEWIPEKLLKKLKKKQKQEDDDAADGIEKLGTEEFKTEDFLKEEIQMQ